KDLRARNPVVRGAKQAEPVRAPQSFRPAGAVMQRSAGGAAPGRDLSPRPPLGCVREDEPPSTAAGRVRVVTTHRATLRKTVAIGCYVEGFNDYGERTPVAIDVLRATATAVTAVALGRRCLPVGTLEDAERLARELDNVLLAGELGGEMPYG